MRKKIISKYREHKETLENIFWRSLQIFSKQGIIFLIFILSAKILNPYDFGIYNYLINIILILIIFSDFGISIATSKYISEYNTENNKNKLKEIFYNSALIISLISIIIIFLILILGQFYLKKYFLQLLIILPLIILIPITSLYDGIYRGLKKFKELALISFFVGLFSIILIYYITTKYGLNGALISQNIFYLVYLIILGLNYKDFEFKFNYQIIKEISKYSFIIGIASIGSILYGKIDVLFLGHYKYIIEIGYYEIIIKILSIALIPFLIIAQVIAPDITKYFYKKEYKILKNRFIEYLIISAVLSILTILALVIFKLLLLKYFLPEYNTPLFDTIFNLMIIMFFTQMLNGIIPVGFVTPTGHAKLSLYFLLIFGIIHIILNIILIDIYGFIGIIYSLIFTRVIADILFIYYYWKILKKLN